MQKKSLLVALFCGALCLTGCLKNEESASVEQVRLAKAEELKASATLKNAKAQAEVIYANAEATLKQAQAALLNAQAETEKVRAELLKVRVKLAEVQVEEEKVELQKRQAELEVLLAQAEAGKQFWINALNNLLAQAEIDALQNAHDVLDAIALFEESNIDDAEYYAGLYYDALTQVQALELQQLAIKAEKALVKAGVKAAKKSINFELEQIDNQIAENEEMIAALKARQNMDPEEAEAALKEARIALSDAYNDYQDAIKARTAASNAIDDINNKQAEFQQDWWNFEDGIYNKFGFMVYEQYLKPEEYKAADINATIGVYGVFEDNNTNKAFTPLWHGEWSYFKGEHYPGGQVYPNDAIWVSAPVFAPSTIYYDNIETVLTKKVADLEDKFADALADYAEDLADEASWYQEDIDDMDEQLAMHQKYVDARKAKVEAAEKKFLEDLGNDASAKSGAAKAWADFQEYWLLKYDASRQLIIDRYVADTTYQGLNKIYGEKLEALNQKKASIASLETALENAEAAEIKAEATYNTELAKANKLDTEDPKIPVQVENAKAAWNPDFDSKTAVESAKGSKHWVNKDSKGTVTAEAGTTQDATLNANEDVKVAQKNFDDAEENLERNPKGTAGYDAAKAAYDAADEALNGTDKKDGAKDTYNKKVKAESDAKKTYNDAVESYEEVYGAVDKAKEAWNPKFKLEGAAKATEGKNKGKWVNGGEVAGTTQADVLDAKKDLADANADVKAGGKTYDACMDAKKAAEGADGKGGAKKVLADAEKALKDKIGATNDPEAVKLYEAYLAAAAEAEKAGDSWAELQKLYLGYNPDEIADLSENPANNVYAYNDEEVFGWLNSNYQLDYNATKLTSKGKKELIGKYLYPGIEQNVANVTLTAKWNGTNFWTDEAWKTTNKKTFGYNSLSFWKECEQKFVDAVPTLLAQAQKIAANKVAAMQKDADEVIAAANAFKAKENSYKAWVAEKAAAYEPYNEARKAVYDTRKAKDAAQADYKAIEAVANQKIFFYDPKVDGKNITGKEPNAEGFVELTIQEEIDRLQGTSAVLNDCVAGLIEAAAVSINLDGDLNITTANISAIAGKLQQYAEKYGTSIVGLNVVKKLLEKVLEYGDVAESTVLEMLDERLEWNEEQIAILNAVAAKYQSLMYMYLGIDAEDVLGAAEEE